MNTSDFIDSRPAVDSGPNLIDGIARRQVFNLLQRLQRGRLIIHESGGQPTAFGQSQGEASVSAVMHVEHPSVFRQLAFGGSIGAGESYMSGLWHTPDLVKLVRLFAGNLELVNSVDRFGPLAHGLRRRLGHGLKRNTRRGAQQNIRAHYDLSNDFFALFLDRSMMYSAAIYPSPGASLEQASLCKMQHVCERLDLQPGDHLLEIGTGWGSLAMHAAQNFGCKVTTTTLSPAQYAYACEQVKNCGLGDRVEVLNVDYRELTGRFDKLVSIEMIEAVGHQYYGEYFRQCSSLLQDNGLMLIQAITVADQRYRQAVRSVDFIQKYIFPGGCLPSVAVIASHVAEDTDMQIVGVEDIARDYALTLRDWRQRFLARVDEVKALGFDDEFVRMWEFYLAYCEGGFEERVIGTAQVLMAKPQCRTVPHAVAHEGLRA